MKLRTIGLIMLAAPLHAEAQQAMLQKMRYVRSRGLPWYNCTSDMRPTSAALVPVSFMPRLKAERRGFSFTRH